MEKNIRFRNLHTVKNKCSTYAQSDVVPKYLKDVVPKKKIDLERVREIILSIVFTVIVIIILIFVTCVILNQFTPFKDCENKSDDYKVQLVKEWFTCGELRAVNTSI